MTTIIRPLITLVIALAVAPSALAITTYAYTGNNFSSIPRNDDPPAGTYTTGMGITGSFSVSAALPTGGLAPVGASILSYSFNDGRNTLTEANSVLNVFDIAIGNDGNVSAWEIQIQQPFPSPAMTGDRRVTILSQAFVAGNADEGAEIDVCLADGCATQGIDWGRAFNNPGTWSIVPLPAAGYLFMAALVSVFARARRTR